MLTRGYSGTRAYCQSKLAQIMFTIDLGAALEGTGVTVTCLHPATYMDTSMVRRAGEAIEYGRGRRAGDPQSRHIRGSLFLRSCPRGTKGSKSISLQRRIQQTFGPSKWTGPPTSRRLSGAEVVGEFRKPALAATSASSRIFASPSAGRQELACVPVVRAIPGAEGARSEQGFSTLRRRATDAGYRPGACQRSQSAAP